jgi:hypothetical protein
MLDRINDALGYEVSTESIGEPSDSVIAGIMVFGGGIVLLAVGTVIGVKKAFKLKRLQEFKHQQTRGPGGGPDAAITVTSALDIGGHLGRFKCSCGGPYYKQGEPLPQQEGGVLNGRPLIVVELECRVCKNRNDVYFVQLQT